MLFVPTSNDDTGREEVLCFAQTAIRGQPEGAKNKPWSLFRDWRWRAGCETALGRIMLAWNSQVFVLGNITDPITVDYEFEEDTFSDETDFTDGTGWTMPGDVAGDNTLDYPTDPPSGVPIDFEWILPWADFNSRMNAKQSRYLAFDTSGDGRFTCEMFIDGVIFDEEAGSDGWFTDGTGWTDGTGLTPYLDLPFWPALSSDFVCVAAGGYGKTPYGDRMGSGRLVPDEGLYGWPALFRLAKFRIWGSTKKTIHMEIVMASQVDATVPADNVKADKALFRQNFATIKDEISALQRRTGLAWQTALGVIPMTTL
jgi:hypothetical protein